MRQLENICHWLTVMAPGQQVDLADCRRSFVNRHRRRQLPTGRAGWPWRSTVCWPAATARCTKKLTDSFERILITRALAHTGGRRIEAALALGIGRNTITRKIQDLGLDAGRGDDAEHAAG